MQLTTQFWIACRSSTIRYVGPTAVPNYSDPILIIDPNMGLKMQIGWPTQLSDSGVTCQAIRLVVGASAQTNGHRCVFSRASYRPDMLPNNNKNETNLDCNDLRIRLRCGCALFWIRCSQTTISKNRRLGSIESMCGLSSAGACNDAYTSYLRCSHLH